MVHWYRRNKCRLKEPSQSTVKIFEVAQNLVIEFQAKPSSKSCPPVPVCSRWKPPIPDIYKVNYEGAMFVKIGEVRIGIVVRNEKGKVMASLAEKIHVPSSVEVLEVLAVRRATIFTVELGFHRVIIPLINPLK